MWCAVAFVLGLLVGAYVTYKVIRIIIRIETKQLVIATKALKDIAHWDKRPIYDKDLADLESVSNHAQEAIREMNNVDIPPVKPKAPK